MDAKVGDWVVTPRRGKAVEINALWYNALRLLEGWLREEDRRRRRARRLAGACAEQAPRASFNRRFWNAAGGYLYDVVDGEQRRRPGCRPNQLFAISLPHPVLDRGALGSRCCDVVRERLLTPVRPALAGARPSRLQAALRRRPARARRRLPPGDGLGLADRPVRRRLAEGPSPTTAPARAGSSTASSSHLDEACVGHDQRDLRRRAALHPARLHRPGLERRRGPPRPRRDRLTLRAAGNRSFLYCRGVSIITDRPAMTIEACR